MSSSILLSIAAKYSDDRINASKVSRDCFVTTDSMIQNKGGITITPVLPKGNLIAFYKGDILIGNIRPYLKKIWYSNRNGGCSPDVLVIQAISNIDSKFLYYSLFRDDFFNHMMNGSKGTKMPRGDKSQILRFHIPKIELSTQQKIASVLSTLDLKIELNNGINAELESMAKTLYDYWFVQFDFPDKNGKPYKTSGGKMVWNNELKREIPDGWANATLLNNSLTAIIKPGIDEFSGKKKYLATADINNNDVGLGNEITFTKRESRANMQPEKNSIWFAKMKNSRKQLFVGQNNNDFISKNILSTGFMGLSCNEIAFEYLAGYITSDVFEITKDFVSHGATMQGIGNDDLKFFKIIIPDTDNIINFKKSTRAIYEKMELNRIENQKLTKLRDWLLPMLMNGQVKVG